MAKRKTVKKKVAKKNAGVSKTRKPKNTMRSEKPEKDKKVKRIKTNDKLFPIVGIGASAGGLEAIEGFFTNMPPDANIAFVIIQHLSSRHKSIMPELLIKYTKMRIFVAKDGMKIEPNCIYLNPPDKDVAIINRILYLMEPMERQKIRLPVDYLFRSLSEDQGKRSICIILSGAGTDGTLGLKAIKGVGGLAMVQDEKQAGYDGMPVSAIKTGLVDFILPVEELARELLKYGKERCILNTKRVITDEEHFSDYIQKIFVLIRSSTGHDFSGYKLRTIKRRFEQRMIILGIKRIAEYFQYLLRNPTEVSTLFKDLLIRVTNFFRDPDAYDVLKNKIIPDILEKKKFDTTVRIWVAGCSTGEEAFSIAMVIMDTMNELKKHLNVQIFATDIDEDAIIYARTGIYPDGIAADVSAERLRRFFTKEGSTYKVKKQIRDMLVFAVHSLVNDPPFSRLDMISCRNLLIYMNTALQKKILSIFHYALDQNGFLFLGSSESTGKVTDLFSTVDKKWNLYRRREVLPKYITEAYNIIPSFGNVSELRRSAETEGDEKMFNIDDIIEKEIVEKPLVSGKETDLSISEMKDNLKSYKEYLNVVTAERDKYSMELSSTKEELQTSREELQSTNEELTTINAQLQEKIDELSRTNNDLSNLLSSTEIGTLFLDTKLCIKRFTQPVTKLFSLMEVDIGRPLRHFSTNILYDNIYKDANDVLDTLRNREEEIQTRGGDWYSVRILPYRTVDNVVDGVVITFVDITKLKQAGDALRKNEEKYRAIFEQAADTIVMIDADTQEIVEFNENSYKNLGYTREEFKKIKIHDIDVLESYGYVGKHIEKIKKEGADIFETKHRTKSGEIRDVLVSARILSLPGQNFISSVWRDITEQKRTQERMYKMAEEWEETFNYVSDAISIHDKDFKILRANKSYADLFNKKQHELIGKTCYEVVHGTTEPWSDCPHRQAMKSKRATITEFFEPCLGMYLEVSASPIFDEKGEVIRSVHIMKDITERKKVDSEYQKTIKRLENQLKKERKKEK